MRVTHRRLLPSKPLTACGTRVAVWAGAAEGAGTSTGRTRTVSASMTSFGCGFIGPSMVRIRTV